MNVRSRKKFSIMQHLNPYLAARVISYLNDEEKLALRAVNSKFRELLRDYQAAPYDYKVEFILGVSGTPFDTKAHINPETHEYIYDRIYLDTAWYVYDSTVTSTSLKPAILYKLKDVKKLEENVLDDFAEHENLEGTGRIYSPHNQHTWPVNQIWVLAQTHIGRPFEIHAPITLTNIIRSTQATAYSAFIKEIATAMKAGYRINVNNDNNKIWLFPSGDTRMRQLSVKDIELSQDDMKDVIQESKRVQDICDENQNVHSTVSALMQLYLKMDTLDVKELQLLKKTLHIKIVNILSTMYATSHNKKHHLKLFIAKFNSCFTDDVITLSYDSKMYFFDIGRIFKKTKNDVISAMTLHLEDCIEDFEKETQKTMTLHKS